MKKLVFGFGLLILATSVFATCFGDVNNDGVVNPIDSGAVLARYCELGSCSQENLDLYDVNKDGAINSLDSNWVSGHFGFCSDQPPTDTDFGAKNHTSLR